MNYKKLYKYKGRRAVSPVVATLILIIVAIVGAIAVGLIMSGIAHQTQGQANGNVNAQDTLYLGGSTTLYPAVTTLATNFETAHANYNVEVQQGGSGAGMTGVALGVLDIGDASSASAVSSAQSEFPTANLIAQEVGGSAVVFIANFGTTSTGICGGEVVVGVTQAALQELYGTTANGYGTPTCTAIGATTDYMITAFAAGAGSGSALSATNIAAVSRGDLPSGTEDTACSYLTTSVCASTSNNAVALPGLTETGNPGVLAEVQAKEFTVGFVDIGFAEGASVTAGSTTAAGVTVLAVQSTADTTLAPVACVTGSATTLNGEDCWALPGTTTGSLDSFIKASLSNTSPSASTPVYPDSTSGTGLTRTFWMVTKGPATAVEQTFINFAASPAQESAWNNAGYYTVYQITPITPP